MKSKPIGRSVEVLRPILTVENQADFAEAMRQRRLALGWTQMELDHIAGFHDGYAAHLERPFSRSGRKSFTLSRMAVIWLEALGLELCIRQRTEPTKSSAVRQPTAFGTLLNKDAQLHPRPAQQVEI